MRERNLDNIDSVIIHCTDSSWCTVEVCRKWHVSPSHGYDDIGYHFMIGNGYVKSDGIYLKEFDGLIEIGRDFNMCGAHARGYNRRSVGIVLVGKDQPFTFNQAASLLDLINELKSQLGRKLKILCHYEVATDGRTCPNIKGDHVRSLLIAT